MSVKKASQGAVTSIADTDLVMAYVNGGYHPISFANLMKAVRGGIQVGGRNLLKDSDVAVTNSNYAIARYDMATLPKVGERLLVTIWGSLGASREHFNAFNGIGDGNRGLANVIKVADGVYQGVLPILADPQSHPYVQVYAAPQSGSGTSTITRIKLERGNIATDWTPAPEDIASGAWGGVIGCYVINYDSAEKGGAHERREEAVGQAEVGADCHLAFGSLDALERFVGRACEDRCIHSVGDAVGSECKNTACLQRRLHERDVDSMGMFSDGKVDIPESRTSRRYTYRNRYDIRHRPEFLLFLSGGVDIHWAKPFWRTLHSSPDGGRTSIVGSYIVNVKPKERKEVAYGY